MKHHIIKLSLAFVTVAAVVGSTIYLRWPDTKFGTTPMPAVGPPPAEAAPTVTWTPSAVSESVQCGATRTITVALVSTEMITNAVVAVVPELQPLVSVTPSTFGTIPKAQRVEIKVTINGSTSSLPGTTKKGTLHLRAGSRGARGATLARPLPITLRIGDAMTATSVFDSVRGSMPSILDAVPTSIIFTAVVNTVALEGAHVRLLKYDRNGSFIADLGEMHDDGAQGDAVANDGIFSRQITATETGPGFVVYRSAFIPRTGCPDLSDTLILPIVVQQDPENVLDSLVLDLRTGNLPRAYERLGSALNRKRTLDGLSSTALNALADSLAQRRLVEARDDLRIYSGPVVDGGGTRDVAFMLVRDSGGVWRVTSW